MTRRFVYFCVALVPIAYSPLLAQQATSDPVVDIMQQELSRSFKYLKKAPAPPYFLSYQLTDNRAIQISASFGALTNSQDHVTRLLDIDLRVGDPTLDNTHPVRSEGRMDFEFPNKDAMPIEDGEDALRVSIWQETEKKYRRAVQQFEQVKANVQVKVAQEDRSKDFSQEPVESYREPIGTLKFDSAVWENRLRKATVPFSQHREIVEGEASVSAELETRRYVNTDGSKVLMSSPFYRVTITATAKADDGMLLPLHQTYMSFRPDGLPDDATLERDVAQMVKTLLALHDAPMADPYTGPAILSGRSSAVFFHEIFGHRIEGQRQKNEDEAQTFKKRVNQSVLPDFLSVYSDPTVRQIAGTELVGYYPYDDEGVKAHRLTVVDHGILKTFLMSRTPIQGFDHSNGHGRRQQGYKVVARQSNLIVESSKQVSRAELKKLLIEQIKAANKPYGLVFDDIEGGFTFTQRILPNAFNVRPTVVYRVYPDGKEELVRGVDLIGTPLIAFSKIIATDDNIAVFNGVCGAESGWVPVSASSPGLLVSQMEVQRKEKSQERAPLLPPPSGKGN